eukprot:COSAG05_NODE_954_length_6442_cov_451.572915_5_plen_100_part_00
MVSKLRIIWKRIHTYLAEIAPLRGRDRQPYLTDNGVDDGFSAQEKYGSSGSIIKKNDVITKNIFINGYNGVWNIDHDDGSQFMNDTGNVSNIHCNHWID